MKFGKEFKAQMVPEWQEAYMDYDFLKKLIKEIEKFKKNIKPVRLNSGHRAFSGLIERRNSNYSQTSDDPSSSPSNHHDIEIGQDIVVDSVISRTGTKSYETVFLKYGDEGGEQELAYFKKLDEEFNKVEKFYKMKVDEVLKEAELLDKQMEALLAFRIKVKHPSLLDSNHGSADAALEAEASGRIHVVDVGLVESSSKSEESSHSRNEDDDDSISPKEEDEEGKSKNFRSNRPAPLEILNRVTIVNTLGTPRSTIKGILKVDQNSELQFTKENLRRVEQQLKQAFTTFYHKLRLLKNYSFLNISAFSKIMKKYEKITSREAAKTYMKTIDQSFLGSSDDVTKLIERAESAFIKHFHNGNRSKGMGVLRPIVKRERHTTTFSLGFLSGCTVALIIAVALTIHMRNLMNNPGREIYMRTMFPLYSLFGFIVLHMFMYAGNIYFWRRYRVNYSFIFGFKQGTELGYRQVMLVGFVIALLALGAVLANLDMEMDPETEDYQQFTEFIPFGLVILLLIILVLPLNVLYRSARMFFLTCVLHCILAPLYKVTLPDFFLADQLTSQVQAFRSLEFYICYYGWGDYKVRQNTCKSSHVYNSFCFVVAAIPYWARFLQCIRRLIEEKDHMHGVNGAKYFVTIIAVCLRSAYSLNKGFFWGVAALVFSVIAAVFGTYWDLVIDWGLLQKNSKNFFLRDKLLVPKKSVYYIAMAVNVLLRFAWLQTVLNFKLFSFLHRETWITIVASLEIIRRGIWNFFRLENEHLNNVGKYRAFKSVPLPFNYGEDDDKND